MSAVDIGRARAFLRRRSGHDRPARDPFVVAAQHSAADIGPDHSLDQLLGRIADLSAGVAALAAVAEQRREVLGLAEPLRLTGALESVVARAALSFEDTSQRRAELCTDREMTSRSKALPAVDGRGAER